MSEGEVVHFSAVRLRMKLSSECSHQEFETARLNADHSMLDDVMLLDDSDVGRSIERCCEVFVGRDVSCRCE